jgi:hypothetical protein
VDLRRGSGGSSLLLLVLLLLLLEDLLELDWLGCVVFTVILFLVNKIVQFVSYIYFINYFKPASECITIKNSFLITYILFIISDRLQNALLIGTV